MSLHGSTHALTITNDNFHNMDNLHSKQEFDISFKEKKIEIKI